MLLNALRNGASSLFGLLSVAAVCSALVGCDDGSKSPVPNEVAQGGSTTPKLEKVKLQLNWVAEPEFGGFYAAQDKALFQNEGIEVEIVQGGPGVPAPQLAASGKVEFAVVAAPQVVELAEQGGDLVALFAVYQGTPMGVMVHESSPYNTLNELWQSDATISIEQGHADYRWISKQYPDSKIKVVPYSGNLAGFAADPKLASQCFITSEPVQLELQGVKTRVFMLGDSGFDPYNGVVVTTRAYYEAHRDLCKKLVKAMAAGWRAYLDNPKPYNETMTRLNPGMNLAAMNLAADKQAKLIANDETKRVGLGGMRFARWEEMCKQLVELGTAKKMPDVQSLFVWDTEAGTAR